MARGNAQRHGLHQDGTAPARSRQVDYRQSNRAEDRNDPVAPPNFPMRRNTWAGGTMPAAHRHAPKMGGTIALGGSKVPTVRLYTHRFGRKRANANRQGICQISGWTGVSRFRDPTPNESVVIEGQPTSSNPGAKVVVLHGQGREQAPAECGGAGNPVNLAARVSIHRPIATGLMSDCCCVSRTYRCWPVARGRTSTIDHQGEPQLPGRRNPRDHGASVRRPRAVVLAKNSRPDAADRRARFVPTQSSPSS